MHPDDELLSALLDGEAPSGDAAHVDGCQQCQERVGELRRASTLVATAVHLPAAHLREASLAIALDAPTRRLPSAGTYRRWNGLSAAAALVVALAVGGLAITQIGRSGGDANRDDASTSNAALAPSTADLDASAGGVAAGSGPAEDSSELSTMAAAPFAAGELGAYGDVGAVVSRATADLDLQARGQGRSVAQDSPCPVEIPGQTLWHATLSYKSEAAVAHFVETENGRLMQILRRADCSLLVSQAT